MKRIPTIIVALGTLALAGTAAFAAKQWIPGTPAEEPTADWYGDAVTSTIGLDQGWNAEQIEWFYTTSQGSQLMPYSFFLALEQADSAWPFRSPHNMQKYRYLTGHKSPKNPDGLPVGFVKSGDSVGMTCAACHTAQLDYKGTGIRVEGGPTMANFGGFMDGLIAAVDATLRDDAKLERFCARVAGQGASSDEKSDVGGQLAALDAQLVYWNEVNTAGVAPYGFGRIDAFGRIYNRALTLVDPTNGNPASAPVSYPFLWDTPQHDYVQWVGNASNANVGELQRNIGEAIGVFGSIAIDRSEFDLHGYKSSIDVKNLNELGAQLRLLESPLWPEQVLPALDRGLVQKGAAIYAKECGGCHLPIDRTDPKRVVRAQMYGLEYIETDPTAAQNIVRYGGKSGILEGHRELIVAGAALAAEVPALAVVTNLVAGILESNVEGTLAAELGALRVKDGGKAPERQGRYTKTAADPDGFLAYKARPLNGIWATAPFLHNGSVPTLWDLMSPPAARPKKFYVGRYELDPKKVGILTDEFEGGYELDTSLPGNSNAGHEYGTTLSDADRWAVVEYLKSL